MCCNFTRRGLTNLVTSYNIYCIIIGSQVKLEAVYEEPDCIQLRSKPREDKDIALEEYPAYVGKDDIKLEECPAYGHIQY
jgi:hypothetical protein